MTTMREWTFSTMVNDPGLAALVGGRVVAGSAITVSPPPVDRPFIIYRFGNSSTENLVDIDIEMLGPEQQYLQVWVHDEKGDYLLIDQIISALKRALCFADKPPGLFDCRYLETSRDLEDDALGTGARYVRFLLVAMQ